MRSGVAISIAGAILASIPAGWLLGLLVRTEAGAHPSIRSTMVAVAVAVSVWGALVMPPNYLLIATLVLGWALVGLSAVDYLVFRLPDRLTFPLIGLGLVLSYWLPDRDVTGHLVGAAAGFAVLYAIATVYRHTRDREGLGLGDAKLAAAAGAWLGWQPLPAVLLIACAASFVWFGIAMARRGRSAMHERIPFGLPLCIAFWLVWLYGVPDFGGIV